MQKVNTTKMAELTWSSPKGKFSGAGKEISEALGRKPESTDLNERHPFDVEILRIPPGKAPAHRDHGVFIESVTWRRPTTSSPISSRLIFARPITRQPMATAPSASAPAAIAPAASAPMD